MNLESVDVEAVLLALKIGFLVLLYLFIWRIVRTASRDVTSPQESFVLAPSSPSPQPAGGRAPTTGRLVVVTSPALDEGHVRELNSRPVTIGRSSRNDLPLRGDRFASAQHARVERRPDGVWVVDDGSTNGTFVNGVRVEAPHRLAPGDVVRVGETDLRYEA
ncbi:MAG: FHA domain-containing protein [Thermoleophilia bacterium]|nr:FHA domain-containing protein [Thermoleophilia bacterium]